MSPEPQNVFFYSTAMKPVADLLFLSQNNLSVLSSRESTQSKRMRYDLNTSDQVEPMFLRLSEVAKLLDMSRSCAYEAMRKGAIPAVLIDGKWRVPRIALERMAEQAMQAASSKE
jgi:excisionase family DNA binding protein